MKRITTVFLIIMLFTGCGYDLSDNNSVTDLLTNHEVNLQGKMNFNKNGTFSVVPASHSDPTRLYSGTWQLGECQNCDSDNPKRDITIKFQNFGWLTDGHDRSTGYGRELIGYIIDSREGWRLVCENNDYGNGGLVYDSNAGSSGGFVNAKDSKYWSKELKEKD